MSFVRIIILNYNNSKYTLDLVRNLANQQMVNFEIVVVDNCSRKSEVQLLKTELPNDVICLFSSENNGYSAGNNIGMRYKNNIKPEFFFILNNDIKIEDKLLINKLLSTFNMDFDNELVAVSPLVNTISTNTNLEDQIQVRRLLPSWKLYIVLCRIFSVFTRPMFNNYVYKSEMPYVNKIMPCDSINGAAFIVRADFMRKINYLDEGTFLFFEEIILAKQIKEFNGICALNGFTSLSHLQGVSTKSNGSDFNLKMEKYKVESELHYFQKYSGFNKLQLKLYSLFKWLEINLKLIKTKLNASS